MRIIVCGAGQVGTSIARQLSLEENDVTVIDQSPRQIQKISDTLDVKARVGFASHPTVLEEVGAAEADMLIAVTQSDEVNMIACQVAHSLFNVPTKIARIRNQNYLKPEWRHLFRHDHLPIDHIISPEIEVGKAIVHCLHVPGAVDTIPFMDGLVKVIGVRCTFDCPMINMPLISIQERMEGLRASILGVMRDENFQVMDHELELLSGDELYFSCHTADASKVMMLFGHDEREARRIVIIGGGNIGLYLADHLEQEGDDLKLKIIELDKIRADMAAEKLSSCTVINGDALSQEILSEANVPGADTVIAVSNDDEVNILSSLLSKRMGSKRVITLVNNTSSYSSLVSSLGIDVGINPREITVSSILQHIRKGRILSVHSICKGRAEVIEAEAVEVSSVVGKTLSDLALPMGIVIGSIVRKDEVINPQPDLVIESGDRVIILSHANMVKRVEKIFSVKFDFF